MEIDDKIKQVRAHFEVHKDKERATFSIDGIKALLDWIDNPELPYVCDNCTQGTGGRCACSPKSAGIDFRSIGFTEEAANYPRGELALLMFAAFNGVPADALPKAMHYFPNERTAEAWQRVADAVVTALSEGKCQHVWGVVPDGGKSTGNRLAYCIHCGRSPEGMVVMLPVAALTAQMQDVAGTPAGPDPTIFDDAEGRN